MNFQEIVAKLAEVGIGPEELATEDFEIKDSSAKFGWRSTKPTLEEIFGPFRNVAKKGGEGQGEEWWTITYFEAHDVYIRVDAFYMSYDGTDFSDSEFKQVRPVRVEVTEYQAC